MKSLCDEVPLIQLGAGGAVALNDIWLEQCLECAGRAAGYTEWPAADVALSVATYLEQECLPRSFSFEAFSSVVQCVLQNIGYGDVAPHFLRSGLELKFSLLDLVEELPVGFELGLFKACRDLCQRLLASGAVSRLSFEDLRPAVKTMLARAHWCPTCETLAEELVVFLREHLLRVSGLRPLCFSIC